MEHRIYMNIFRSLPKLLPKFNWTNKKWKSKDTKLMLQRFTATTTWTDRCSVTCSFHRLHVLPLLLLLLSHAHIQLSYFHPFTCTHTIILFPPKKKKIKLKIKILPGNGVVSCMLVVMGPSGFNKGYGPRWCTLFWCLEILWHKNKVWKWVWDLWHLSYERPNRRSKKEKKSSD